MPWEGLHAHRARAPSEWMPLQLEAPLHPRPRAVGEGDEDVKPLTRLALWIYFAAAFVIALIIAAGAVYFKRGG